MKIEKNIIYPASEAITKNNILIDKANLVFYFGERALIEDGAVFQALKQKYPNAIIIGCSTGGEIFDNDFHEESVVSIAIQFEKTPIRACSMEITEVGQSFENGVSLGKQLNERDLKAVFVLSEGLIIDGSKLTQGISQAIGPHIPITGGLAGDGSHFGKTVVGLNSTPRQGQIVAVGFYGDHIRFGHGSMGGWDIFGPTRIITRSEGSVLYEIDGKPALDVYKRYLGHLSERLPASALTFPMTIHHIDDPKTTVVRTILSVNEDDKSMNFAGTIPEGHVAQFLRGTLKHLVEGAENAALQSLEGISNTSGSLAIMISCIGRKLLMGQRVIDEIDAVSNVFKGKTSQIGFYSYGEISPHAQSGFCELHNQTMTITTLSEAL